MIPDITRRVLEFFDQINEIPRCSEHESALAEWLFQWATNEGLHAEIDATGNVLIAVPPTRGYEHTPPVIVQGHLDMVCEKTPESTHNFATDKITNILEGDWVHANDTSLGADNGIAIALAMALVTTPNIEHGPLEFVFTVEEETGMKGANEIDPAKLTGTYLLNLDSEDEGVFTIGCAGGQDTRFTLPITRTQPPASYAAAQITITGLRGGHSGIDIDKKGANAIILMTRFLQQLPAQETLHLISLSGGSAKNAIPRDCTATIAAPPSVIQQALQMALEYNGYIRQTYPTDPDATLSVNSIELSLNVVSAKSTHSILSLLNEIPHGVIAMCNDMTHLVETSTNLAVVDLLENDCIIWTSQRSCLSNKLSGIVNAVIAIGEKYHTRIDTQHKYPPWAPNFDSPLLALSKKIYVDLFGKEAVVETIHAGLECGILGEKIPGLDMISLGPTLQHPHSPNERLQVSSIEKVFLFLAQLLKSMNQLS